jgi:hypothetical protein
MKSNDMEIIRFSDGAMDQQEKEIFLAQTHADPELREALETEEFIQRTLLADAAIIEQSEVFETTPGAALIERLAMTETPSRSKAIYYGIGAALLLVLLAFWLLRPNTQQQNSVGVPASPHTQQPAPSTSTPSEPAPADQGMHVPARIEQSKGNDKVETPKTQKEIDLDQDLKGKSTKIFTDPKGHMPINK